MIFRIPGKIISSNGTVAGASITVTDPNNNPVGIGKVADANGQFVIEFDHKKYPQAEFLLISSVGYKPEQRLIRTIKDPFEVVLQPASQILPEVSVVAKSPKNLAANTSNISKISTLSPVRPNIQVPLGPPRALDLPKPLPSPAKGLEKFVLLSANKLGDFEEKIDSIFEKYFEKPLKALNEVDLCNIINYSLSKIQFDFKKNPDLKFQLDKIKATAANINEAISNFTTYSTANNLPRTAESIRGTADSNQGNAQEREKLNKLLEEIKALGINELRDVPTGLVSVVPGLGKIRSTVEDISSLFTRYGNINTIPNEDFQKVVRKVYDLQGILGAVATLGSAQGLVNLLGIQKQIQKLQQFINPARLIPSIKKILQIAKNINQVGLKILKIISFAKSVTKILTILIKVFRVIVTLFHTLPLPNMFSIHGITSTLETVKAKIQDQSSKVLKFLGQINRLLAIVYEFIQYLLGKVDIVIRELQILLVNLMACEQTKDLALVQDVKTTITATDKTRQDLKTFSDNYDKTQTNRRNTLKIPGYSIVVQEEEVVDEGKKLKRRRAIAYNDRGILILQGDLTFATDNAVLIEELRLRLLKEGFVAQTASDTSTSPFDEFSDDANQEFLDVDQNLNEEEVTAAADALEVQNDLDDFISGLKNGRALKKKARRKVTERIAQTKAQVKQEGGTATSLNTVGSIGKSAQNAAGPQPKTLSESDKKKLKAVVIAAKFTKSPIAILAAEKARKRLQEDEDARAEIAVG